MQSWPTWSRTNSLESSIPKSAVNCTERLDEILCEWPASRVFSARALLRQHPELAENRSAVVAIAAEEYLRERMSNRSLDIGSFAAGFGDLRESVARAAEVMDFFLDSRSGTPSRAPPEWPSPGDQFLHFDLLEELGGGQLSRVFIARDNAIAGRHVVTKLTWGSEREIRALGGLSHPGIVPILSIYEDQDTGLVAVVMPFQSRVTLHDVIGILSELDHFGWRDIPIGAIDREVRRRNSLEPRPGGNALLPLNRRQAWLSEWTARMGAAVADALHAGHENGVLHCDVKPSNIVLVDPHRPMLVDFNLCLGQDARRVAVGGTIPYMSQEQLSGAPLDERADVFSLAATLYHVLTGAPPFGGPDLSLSRALSLRMSGHARADLRFRQLAEIDGPLAWVIRQGLAFEPSDRFRSAAEFAEALRRCLRGRSRVARVVRRRKQQVQAAFCSASLLIAGLGFWQSHREPLPFRATRAAIRAAENGEYETCIRHASTALDADPDLAAALVIRADAQLQRGQLPPAFADLKLAVEHTSSAEVRMLLAYLNYLFTGADDEAIVDLQLALKSGLNKAQLHNNLGYCYLLRGKLAEAQQELEAAIAMDPKLVSAWYNRAVVDLKIALQPPALPQTKFIDTAVELYGNSPELQRVAVDVYVHDAFVRRSTQPKLVEHCARALGLGLPAADLGKTLDRLGPDLKAAVLAQLSAADKSLYGHRAEHVEGFVSPCDPLALATALLERAKSRPEGSSTASGVDDARTLD